MLMLQFCPVNLGAAEWMACSQLSPGSHERHSWEEEEEKDKEEQDDNDNDCGE